MNQKMYDFTWPSYRRWAAEFAVWANDCPNLAGRVVALLLTPVILGFVGLTVLGVRTMYWLDL